jgi:CRISPR/Cas system-associated exonuclease Cas4 (RecB family)
MGRKAVTPVKKTNFDVKAFHDSIVQAHKDSLKSEYKRKNSFAPSTVGYGHGKCPRYWYYAFSGTEFADKNDYKSLSNMANGRDAHERIQKIIDKTPYNVVVEQEALSSDPPIRGFIDLELVDFNVPVEIKTTNDDQYRLHKVSGTVSPSHKVQTLIYMKIRGASEGIVMYENKNTHEIHMVPVVMTPANEKFIDYVFDWMRNVKAKIDEGAIPMRKFQTSPYVCKNCPVGAACFLEPDGNENVEELKVPTR